MHNLLDGVDQEKLRAWLLTGSSIGHALYAPHDLLAFGFRTEAIDALARRFPDLSQPQMSHANAEGEFEMPTTVAVSGLELLDRIAASLGVSDTLTDGTNNICARAYLLTEAILQRLG